MFRRRGGFDRQMKIPSFGGEVPAGNQISLGDRAALDGHRVEFSAHLLAELNHIQRLVYMQRARVALGVAAVVIVNAVGQIGVLLNLAEDQASADGMRGTRRDEHRVIGLHGDAREVVFRGALLDRLAK